MMRWVLLFVVCFLLCDYGRLSTPKPLDDPDLNRNVSELISSKGYPLEEYTVQTTDGYLLSMQRIPHGRFANPDGKGKEAALLVHGNLGDAANWVLNFQAQSLAFVLADAGYDVWLINTRGCTYSKKHVKYTTKQYEFWNYSLVEMGEYDVPAAIDFILDATGKEDLFIIAHSQGNAEILLMLCDRPEYNDKVKLLIALAPAVSVKFIPYPTRLMIQLAKPIAFIVDLLTYGELLPNNNFVKTFQEFFCGLFAVEVCEDIVFAVGGDDRKQLNETRLAVYSTHFPSGTSTKNLLYYKQLLDSGKFRKYDYGRRLNMEYYHQEEPPEFDLSRITAPVALMWSLNDKLADPIDLQVLRKSLTSLVLDYQVPYPYEHFDFLIALNAFEMVHKPILQLLSRATQ